MINNHNERSTTGLIVDFSYENISLSYISDSFVLDYG